MEVETAVFVEILSERLFEVLGRKGEVVAQVWFRLRSYSRFWDGRRGWWCMVTALLGF
jgi:hypothetical protein